MFETLGFKLDYTEDVSLIRPLLHACHLEALAPSGHAEDVRDEYVMATTRAGGVAACAGWTRQTDSVVIHSLAVAPPSRGSGVGVALLAHTLHQIMEQSPVEAIYLHTTSARRFFGSFGFVELGADEPPPAEVQAHAAFAGAAAGSTPMIKRYTGAPRGLGQCAFRVMHNITSEAALPHGSVIFVRQHESMLEAQYRGGPVIKGHMLGKVSQDEIAYLWQSFLVGERLTQGSGMMQIRALADGRRELIEGHGADLTLWLREA